MKLIRICVIYLGYMYKKDKIIFEGYDWIILVERLRILYYIYSTLTCGCLLLVEFGCDILLSGIMVLIVWYDSYDYFIYFLDWKCSQS